MKNMNQRAYIFMASGILIFGALIFAAGFRQGWFSSSKRYTVLFENGEGVFVGTPVSISGLRAGTVESVELNHSNKIEVKIKIQSKFSQHIREDSKVMIGRPFIIGERAISISPGRGDKAALAEYSVLEGEESLEITDMLSGGRLSPYFNTFSKLLEQMRIVIEGDGTQNAVNLVTLYKQAYSSLKSIDSLSKEFSSLKSDVNSVAKSPEMKKIVSGVSNSTEDIGLLLKETNKALPAIVDLSDKLVQMMPQLSKTLNETVFTMQAMQRSFVLSGGVKSLKNDIEESKEKGRALPQSPDVLGRDRSPAGTDDFNSK
jgi:phospholipid/cholesterol/gamma-HCH transport system substrate-binding protein